MANYEYSTANGVIIPDTSEILETVQTEFQSALGSDLSLEESTPQGRLIDTEVTARENTIAFNAQIANVLINIALSAGVPLDAWGANFGIERNGASSSTCYALCTGIAGTVIPAESEALDDNGIIWKSESEIILDGNGEGTGIFYCSDTGEIELGAGELTQIVSGSTIGVTGWETITNTTAADLGSDIESDTSYRQRILNSIFSGSAMFGNYSSAVYKVDNVTDCLSKENPYSSDLIFDNVTIPAHSVFVCVEGGEAYDTAYALYTVKSAGCGWCGNTTVVVTDETYGTENTVIFYTPSAVNFVIDIEVTSVYNSSSDLESDIKEVIVNYFNNEYADDYGKIGIRAKVDPFVIASILASKISDINVSSVKIGLETAANHAIPSMIKASITSGITWVSVDSDTFASAAANTNGFYTFTHDGSDWLLNGTAITLSDYGLTVTGTPVEDDKIQVLFSTGGLSANAIQIFATETANIDEDSITVTVNG